MSTRRDSVRRGRWAIIAHGALIAALTAALLGASAAADETAAGNPTLASGADIYAHICQGCHMPNGTGASGAGHYPPLAGDPALASWQYAAVTVLNGRKNMPAFGTWSKLGPFRFTVHLSDAQVAEVVNYVRTHFGNRWSDRVDADQVKSLPHPADPTG